MSCQVPRRSHPLSGSGLDRPALNDPGQHLVAPPVAMA
jgi:hypothetical protein